jgi:RNA-directed DNA polymerase
LGEGDGWVVDLALEKFFDRVNNDQRMSLVKKRVADRRVLPRLTRDRKAVALTDAGMEATMEGTPPGAPWSPVRANLRWDGLDQEWERRGTGSCARRTMVTFTSRGHAPGVAGTRRD